MIHHASTKHKKAYMTVLYEKVDFNRKSISRDKEEDLTVIKWPLHQGNITVLKWMYSTTELQSTELTELKRETDTSTIIDFKTPFLVIDRTIYM